VRPCRTCHTRAALQTHGYFVQGMGKIFHGGYDDEPTWSVPWQTPRRCATRSPRTSNWTSAGTKSTPTTPRRPGRSLARLGAGGRHDGREIRHARAGVRRRRRAGRHVPGRQGRQSGDVSAARPRQEEGAVLLAVDSSSRTCRSCRRRSTGPLRSRHDPAGSESVPPKDAPEYSILPGGELRNYHGIPKGPVLPISPGGSSTATTRR